jgi:hypothetical protein
MERYAFALSLADRCLCFANVISSKTRPFCPICYGLTLSRSCERREIQCAKIQLPLICDITFASCMYNWKVIFSLF